MISESTSNVTQIVSRARPLARLRANTFRPPFVLIRFLNPWSLFLFKFDGSLKVVDIATLLHLNPAYKAQHYMSRTSVCQSRESRLVDTAAGLAMAKTVLFFTSTKVIEPVLLPVLFF